MILIKNKGFLIISLLFLNISYCLPADSSDSLRIPLNSSEFRGRYKNALAYGKFAIEGDEMPEGLDSIQEELRSYKTAMGLPEEGHVSSSDYSSQDITDFSYVDSGDYPYKGEWEVKEAFTEFTSVLEIFHVTDPQERRNAAIKAVKLIVTNASPYYMHMMIDELQQKLCSLEDWDSWPLETAMETFNSIISVSIAQLGDPNDDIRRMAFERLYHLGWYPPDRYGYMWYHNYGTWRSDAHRYSYGRLKEVSDRLVIELEKQLSDDSPAIFKLLDDAIRNKPKIADYAYHIISINSIESIGVHGLTHRFTFDDGTMVDVNPNEIFYSTHTSIPGGIIYSRTIPAGMHIVRVPIGKVRVNYEVGSNVGDGAGDYAGSVAPEYVELVSPYNPSQGIKVTLLSPVRPFALPEHREEHLRVLDNFEKGITHETVRQKKQKPLIYTSLTQLVRELETADGSMFLGWLQEAVRETGSLENLLAMKEEGTDINVSHGQRVKNLIFFARYLRYLMHFQQEKALEYIKELQQEALETQKAGKKVIIIVAMEGWSKDGGQAEYVRGWSKALSEVGHMVIVLNPYYDEAKGDISKEESAYLFDTDIPLGIGSVTTKVFYNNIAGVHYLRIKDNERLLFPIVYPTRKITFPVTDIEPMAYDNSLLGYIEAILLSKSAMYISMELEIKIDNIVSNDWQAGLIPVYMETSYRKDPKFKSVVGESGVVNVQHNIAYHGMFNGVMPIPEGNAVFKSLLEQGIIDRDKVKYHNGVAYVDIYHLTNLSQELQHRTKGGLEYWSNVPGAEGRHNLLKGGIEFTNIVKGVSLGNSKEIQSWPLGFGLGGVVAARAREGAIDYAYNGADLDVSIPNRLEELKEVVSEEEGLKFTQFTADDIDLMLKRRQNKLALQAKLNRRLIDYKKEEDNVKVYGQLEEDADDFMMTAVSRLGMQKGFSMLFKEIDDKGTRLIDWMLSLRGPNGQKVQFIIMGTTPAGDKIGEEVAMQLRELAQEIERDPAHKYSGQLMFLEIFHIELANQIRASADGFFMPSWYEPGGISNIEAALQGALCFVTLTGGLIDFVDQGGTHPDFTSDAFDYKYPDSLGSSAWWMSRAIERGFQMYYDVPNEWEKWVRKAMKFDASWTSRVPDMIRILEKASLFAKGWKYDSEKGDWYDSENDMIRGQFINGKFTIHGRDIPVQSPTEILRHQMRGLVETRDDL